MASSPTSLDEAISRVRGILAELKKLNLVVDSVLDTRVKAIETQLHDLESRKFDENDTKVFQDTRILLRTVNVLYARVTHPQYQTFISEISRLTRLKSAKCKDLSDFLNTQLLKKRDTILLDYCNQLLEKLMLPYQSYKTHSKKHYEYITGYRPQDEILNEYLRECEMRLLRIHRYFSDESVRTHSQDEEFCKELLSIKRDISEVLTCVRSPDYIQISRTIDRYQERGNVYQATLILDALFATPLKERGHSLSGPSLVKNALATNSDGYLFVDRYRNIDYSRAPEAYRELTGQILGEIKHINVLAEDESLEQIEPLVYQKIHPKTSLQALEERISSPSSVSASDESDADERVEKVFREVSVLGLFKPKETMVKKIARSYDATGDIEEENLDKSPRSDASPSKK